MITQYFEAFTLMEMRCTPDGLGGQQCTLAEVLPFRGALSFVAGDEQEVAGRMALHHDPVLLHEFDVTLAPGDRVRRDATGEMYRVCGRSGDMRTPAFSGLRFAQVPVERWCTPC